VGADAAVRPAHVRLLPAQTASWDPNQVSWVPKEFTFTTGSWGIKANMEQLERGVVRFTHPLAITWVGPGSEAEELGVRPNDVVVGIRTPEDSDFREVKDPRPLHLRHKEKSYVENPIRDILMRGGPCTLRVKRQQGQLVCDSCGCDRMVEVQEAGDLICDNCGLVCRSRIVHMGSEWRTFADDDSKADPNRTGGPENVLLNNNGMATAIQQTGNRATADHAGSAANLSKNQFRGSSHSADKVRFVRGRVGGRVGGRAGARAGPRGLSGRERLV